MFDIVFISYNEPNADENWNELRSRFPNAKRLHGVTGIQHAHRNAAKMCLSEMFWVVDGDSKILEDFTFADPDGVWIESVYVFKAQNPVNGLIYGNGGVKLLPRIRTLNLDPNTVDMTTSIAEHFTAVDNIASITMFNTDPFNTWRSAFRECVKLSSKIIDRQVNQETEDRLNVWCTVSQGAFGNYAIKGALAGKEYGLNNRNNSENLRLINNFDWLAEIYAMS
jgi:hypothetical protein